MEKQMKAAAIYARVSSDKQKEEKTIASQTAALTEFARKEGYDVPREWIVEDEGFSGASLVRPGLERLRDLAAEGKLEAILVYSPDRLSRKYAYQILLTEEFVRNGVETIFVYAEVLSDETSPGEPAARSDPRSQEYRALDDRVSGGASIPRR